MTVQRCVCLDVSFGDIRSVALSHGGDLSHACRETGFGTRCGLCVPYVRYAAATGDWSPPVMWSREFREHGIRAIQIERLERYLDQLETKARSVIAERA